MNRSYICKQNNAQGKNFENQIMSACLGYLYEGRACIDKIPEPFGVSKKDQQTGMFKGRFFGNKKAQPDFQGTIKGGKSIIFEAKTTTKDKISLKVLSSHQEALLEKHYQLGAITAVCVGINNDFYFVPYALWRLCKEQWDKKFFTKTDLEEYKVRFNGAVNFLDLQCGKNVENIKEYVKG